MMGGAGFRLTVWLLALATLVTLALLGPGAKTPAALGAGCGPPRTHASGTTVESISTADGTRSYRLHVPPSYTGTTHVPLILNFHGLGSNAIQQEFYSGLVPVSDASGFILVSPDGTTNGSGQQFWNTVLIGSAPYDIAFTEAILDELEATLCIDPARVFSTGMSNGALMSSRLACSLSSRIAAVAPVAGAYYPPLVTLFLSETCPDTRPVPMIAFHGTADTIVPYNGGPGLNGVDFRLPIDNATSDEDVMEDWAAHNGCTDPRQQTAFTAGVNLIEYGSCNEGADVQLYSVVGGGHTWPGSFNGTQEISAAGLLWAFFQAHPNPDTPPGDIDGDNTPDSLDDDADGDGCPNVKEQGPEPAQGGQRDPKNPWDYFNPTHTGTVLSADISLIVDHYGHAASPPGDPMYSTDYDRSPLMGGLPWQFGPADGAILSSDITAVVNSYGHACS